MIIKKVVEVCKVRKLNNIGCNGCVYHGKTCDHANKILKVNRPSDYELNKEENK